jgi:hypothetical protein
MGHWWLTPVILATQKAASRRTTVQDPISKKPITKKGLMEWLKVKALSPSPSTEKKMNFPK